MSAFYPILAHSSLSCVTNYAFLLRLKLFIQQFQETAKMPVVFTQHGPIPHSVTPNRRQTGDAIDCIHQLTYADAFRVAAKSEMCVANQMRLDMQGIVPATATESARQNLQVQIGPSSVAHVDVSQDLMTDDPQNQIGVIRKIKTGLRLSLQTGNKVHIRGTIT